MPIVSPNLDDLRFTTVRDLLVHRIPIVAPEWTDHNDSDPGIALIQLFAYLAEQIGYRLNRIPDKNYIEFLRLIGVTLRPAEAARTLLQFILTKPELADAFLLPKGSEVKAKSAGAAAEPPVFETEQDLDVVPAQLVALVTTASNDLRDIRIEGESGAAAATDPQFFVRRFALVWDGKSPKLKDMPTQPVPVFTGGAAAGQAHLWIGLGFNPAATAGFLGQRVNLSVQFDDDEQPDPNADIRCGVTPVEAGQGMSGAATTGGLLDPPVISYEYYRPAQVVLSEAEGGWKPIEPISDTTNGWLQSGQLRFDVPINMGPIPDAEWKEVLTPPPLTLSDICAQASAGAGSSPPPAPVPHPLGGAVKGGVDGLPSHVTKVPVSGWLHIAFSKPVSFFLRALSFNVAVATHSRTIRGEVLGRGTGLPGQTFSLSRGNVLAGTLLLAVGDALDGTLHLWTEVEDFDSSAADATVFVLDREAGQVLFGDGVHGRPPPNQQPVVALEYRWGGGIAGEVALGMLSKMDSPPAQVQDVVNLVAATGGKDAETLDEAKRRAPKDLKILGRAVTAEDFRILSMRTPGMRVARSEIVPLRVPFTNLLVDGPGLDMTRERAGALSVIVVPDVSGPFPTPTEGMLRKVCAWLDGYRLVTTEVHVVAPMFVRLYDVCVRVKPKPGFSSTGLRESIAAHLTRYFHVLTGGDDGRGFPFGGSVHHADIVAQVFKVEGVATVSCVEAMFDGRRPPAGGEVSKASDMTWRNERAVARHLTGCIIDDAVDVTVLQLAPDENVFVDPSNLTVSIET